MSGVDVIPVRSRGEMRAFIDLPWTIYQGDANWIPPLKPSLARLLEPKEHPYWQQARRELYLARRGSEVVGRIAAIVDDQYNQYQQERMGAWGFFECRQDPETAAALFATAEGWVRQQGMEFFRGPLNPSLNYEAGLLIQGFASPATLMMTYNPPYYPELVHFCGFRKEKDLLAYHFPVDYHPPEWAISVGQRLLEKEDVAIRPMDPKRFEEEVRLLTEIYNESWARNWGFVPITLAESRDMVKELLPVAELDLTFFVLYRGEPVGVCIIIPDINPLLRRFNGKLGLSALIKKHLFWSEISGLRGLIFGIKEQYRQMGLPLVVFYHLFKVVERNQQYRYVELGWNLEDNDAINRLYEDGGLRPHKRYRIYRKDLD